LITASSTCPLLPFKTDRADDLLKKVFYIDTSKTTQHKLLIFVRFALQKLPYRLKMKRTAGNRAEREDAEDGKKPIKKEKVDPSPELAQISIPFDDMPFDFEKLVDRTYAKATGGTTREKCVAAVILYAKSMRVKKIHGDVNAKMFSICAVADQIWHLHILDTVDYMRFCGANFIHHNPDGALDKDQPNREKRWAAFLKAYEEAYKECTEDNLIRIPDPVQVQPAAARATRPIAPPIRREPSRLLPVLRPTPHQINQLVQSGQLIQVFGKTLTSSTLTFFTPPNASVEIFKAIVADKMGVPIKELRLIFNAQQLQDGATIDHYGIVSNSTVHIVLRMTAC
jgi:hypothetical protein